jgi:hypothetical protein
MLYLKNEKKQKKKKQRRGIAVFWKRDGHN